MSDSEEQARQRKDLTVEAVRILVQLAALNVEHSAGPDGTEARAAFFAQLADRRTRIEFGVAVDSTSAVVTGVEHGPHGSLGLLSVTLQLLEGGMPGAAPLVQ